MIKSSNTAVCILALSSFLNKIFRNKIQLNFRHNALCEPTVVALLDEGIVEVIHETKKKIARTEGSLADRREIHFVCASTMVFKEVDVMLFSPIMFTELTVASAD